MRTSLTFTVKSSGTYWNRDQLLHGRGTGETRTWTLHCVSERGTNYQIMSSDCETNKPSDQQSETKTRTILIKNKCCLHFKNAGCIEKVCVCARLRACENSTELCGCL